MNDSVRPPAPGARLSPRDAERLRIQVGVIRKAMKHKIGTGPVKGSVPPRDDEAHYLFRAGHALVREKDAARIDRFFAARGKEFRGGLVRKETRMPGLTLVALPQRLDGRDDVLATLDELDRDLGPGLVTPDHVVYVTPTGTLCPATEPIAGKDLPDAVFPPPSCDPSIGKGVRVGVVDTGMWMPAVTSPVTPWLDGVVADPADQEVVDPADIHPYAGHGTFVAGVVRCLAPGTRIEVEGVLTHGGAVFESDIVAQLDEALRDDDHPQLISISAGTHTRRDFALLAFEILAAAHGLDDGEETLVIAAAGNDASSDRFWPAAFPWVVSVGSVDPDGAVSDYSNVGTSWVDVYARGRDLVNAFPQGTYTCYEPPHLGEVREFDGLARWSGTSFATPVVTGLVAARMSATGEPARTAWAAVHAAGTPSVDPRGGHITTVGPLT